MICEMNHILNSGNEIKWSYDPRSYGLNFSNSTETIAKNECITARIIASLEITILQRHITSYFIGSIMTSLCLKMTVLHMYGYVHTRTVTS